MFLLWFISLRLGHSYSHFVVSDTTSHWLAWRPIRSQYAATLSAYHLPTVPSVRTQRTIGLCIVSHYHDTIILKHHSCKSMTISKMHSCHFLCDLSTTFDTIYCDIFTRIRVLDIFCVLFVVFCGWGLWQGNVDTDATNLTKDGRPLPVVSMSDQFASLWGD